MKGILSIFFFLWMTFTGYSQFLNVTISTLNYPEEPSIIINPKSPNILVAGANIDSYYYSLDYGQTWTSGTLNSSYGIWGDPCVVADTAGNFYFFHLSNPSPPAFLDRIVCQKSTDNGQTWNNGSYMGLNGSKQQDKAWAVVDKLTNNIYSTWTQFDKYGSSAHTDSSVILFSRSIDGGQNWSPAKRINRVAGDCIDSDNTVEGAVPAIGPNGEIYVSWAGPAGLVFTKSTDGGLTWPADNVFVSDIPEGWNYYIPGISRCNGMPVTCCDLSQGPYRGTIYINWSDQRNGSTDTDIFLVKSTDGGFSWSAPKRVNDDPPGKQQFFTWMTVDQATGILYFVFYDRRNHSDNQTDVYMATSHDGGETFQNYRISESPFLPNSSVFFGDYTAISAWDNMVRPAWARLDNTFLSIVTAIIDSANVLHIPESEPGLPIALEQNYPNPATTFTYMSFKLHKPAIVSLTVQDLYGNLVVTLLDRKYLTAGKYVEGLDLTGKNLDAGIYIYRLITDEKTVSKRMIIN
ncbi:MAG: T9SS type A sorting domain-containing protein [Bacteroidetes bacterium]|nr:T9SS type A sorting domain-containing protein [Bacteroidota bacterium]